MAAELKKNQFIQMASAMAMGHILGDNRTSINEAAEEAVTAAAKLRDVLGESGYNDEGNN